MCTSESAYNEALDRARGKAQSRYPGIGRSRASYWRRPLHRGLWVTPIYRPRALIPEQLEELAREFGELFFFFLRGSESAEGGFLSKGFSGARESFSVGIVKGASHRMRFEVCERELP